MSLLHAILLGIVQGASEFLPISSSGHLVLVGLLLGAAPTVAFDVSLHAGTLVAVVVFYRRDLWVMLRDLWRSAGALAQRTPAREIWARHPGTRLTLLVGLATLPTAIIALAVKPQVERAFASGAFTAAAMVVTGLALLATRLARPALAPPAAEGPGAPTAVTAQAALLIGIAQGIAVFPGISRSGATLVAATFLCLPRSDAARFCFLLSIPAILGAVVLEGRHAVLSGIGLPSLVSGVLAAMGVGYLSLVALGYVIRGGRLDRFGWYLIPVGLGVSVYLSCR
jgi:undecaprenyl-diphosphatase